MQARSIKEKEPSLSIHGLLFQWASTIQIQLSMLVYYKKQTLSYLIEN
jgi:hypothetical protein